MMAWAFLLLVFYVGHSHQLNNGLGLTPQMGMMEIIMERTFLTPSAPQIF